MSFLDFLRPFMGVPLTAATGGSKEDIMRSAMMTLGALGAVGMGGGTGAQGGNPAQNLFGAQGGELAQKLFPDILERIMSSMQQPRQEIDFAQQAAKQHAAMQMYQQQQPVRYPQYERMSPSPPLPGRTRFPLGRRGYGTPERYPVLPKVPETRDQGLKAGQFRQLPWWLKA